ncbi:MAG: helix-turn-helix domain-containing protein [Lachnospiraceae bacterium]|nr:helix-turn-helix domain-containing protein [Lachnospiraceae bacterium]
MNITPEILIFKLSECYRLREQHIGSLNRSVRKILIWTDAVKIEEDVFYIVECSEHFPVKCSGQPPMFLFAGPCDFLINDCASKSVWAMLDEKIPTQMLQIVLLELYNELMNWDRLFAEAILRHADYREVQELGRRVLPWEYGLATWDMKWAYQTPDYGMPMAGDSYHQMVDTLLLDRQFHAAAQIRGSFYYYDEADEIQNICGNICPEGKFLGRIIMGIGERGTTIPDGAREIFEQFTTYIEQLISYHYSAFGDSVKNQSHGLLRQIVLGEQPDPAFQSVVLEKLGWHVDDQYIVILIWAYNESGWDTQMEASQAYLTRKLEQMYPDSCAVRMNSAICWLINLSRLEVESDFSDFREKWASFLRDNVCSAGISADFRDFSLVSYAIREAEIAYEIGKAKNPQFWCFSFDDYRMEYMMSSVKKEFPISMLLHPSISALIDYDEKHGTEYTATLRTYLRCGLNMTSAAEKLFIHRTSFCRRMSRILKLTEIKLDDPDTILELLLSFQLMGDN